MIFPILSGLVGFRKAPVTWLLVALNLVVLLYTNISGLKAQEGLEALMKKDYFIVTQGRVYAQYLSENTSAGYPPFLLELAEKVKGGEKERAEVLGQLAFRDLSFLRAADSLEFDGDQVAFRLWQKQIVEVRALQAEHPSFTFGLNGEDMSLSKWVSYIFVHSGFLHFLGNMLFLVIFGAALERQLGGLALMVLFVLSGVMAAGVFAMMTGVTSSPLVGASGSVSGVMTLYCALNWKRPERYFYWLFLPFRGFMGFVFLPAWVALLMWMVNDMAGYLSSLAELGGVAHTAHLGGEAAGIIAAGLLYFMRRARGIPLKSEAPPAIPMGVLYPFLPRKSKSVA